MYPILLVGVVAVVMLVLLGVVVPQLSQVLDVQAQRLPTVSKWLMAWGSFATAHPWSPMLLEGQWR